MTHSRGRTFRRGGISDSQRRKKTWSGFAEVGSLVNGFELPGATTGGAAGSALSLLQFSAANSILSESTLMRIRGSVSIPKSTPDQAGANFIAAFGIAMVTDEAATAGAVPNPADVNGASWDGWLFYRSTVLDTVETQAGVFDAKAMRKFNGGMSLVFVNGVATDSPAGVASSSVLVVCRGLFLLA